MSSPHGYHHPHGPESPSPSDDQDSDLELDLRELDPQTARRPATGEGLGNGRLGGRASYDYGPAIELRDLRSGYRQSYGQRGRRRAGDDENLEALVGDDRDHLQSKKKSSGSSGAGEDDAPLLALGSGPRPIPILQPRTALGKLRISLGQASRRLSVPYQASSAGPEDHDPSENRTISIIPALRIGYLSTYVAPLAFVLVITLGKEAIDDIARRQRDREANAEGYTVLEFEEEGSGLGGLKRNKRRRKLAKTSTYAKRRQKEKGSGRLTDNEDEEQRIGSRSGNTPAAAVTEVVKSSRDLNVGDVIRISKDQRVPADVVILTSFSADTASTQDEVQEGDNSPQWSGNSEPNDLLVDAEPAGIATENVSLGNKTTTEDPSAGGEAFIRTDQLDGETDWKLRLASQLTQTLHVGDYTRLRITAGKPDKKVNDFIGTIELLPKSEQHYDAPHTHATKHRSSAERPMRRSSETMSVPLTIDNTAWANTVLASSSTVLAVVVYTGSETRSALSTSPSRSKTGLLEHEINSLTKILCILTLTLSFILVALEGFESKDGRKWYVAVMRFLILFSTIVPISLRVNLDMGKSVYAWFIERDHSIPETVVRTSTIPEDLGRIEYLLSDKTGTLTQNEMELKKIHVGTVSYANDAMDEVSSYIRQSFAPTSAELGHSLFAPSSAFTATTGSGTRTRREIGLRVRDLVVTLALCHNVTPTTDEIDGHDVISYQASSPDEIAIVKWTEHIGLRLLHRDRKSITLQFVDDSRTVVKVRILNVFPFTSDSKRMGIIVHFMRDSTMSEHLDEQSEIFFFQKGADTVMTSIVVANDWLDEETANMAREGLRTLVVGRKRLSLHQYKAFATAYNNATLSLQSRDAEMSRAVKSHLEHNLELLGVTGVEDKLQAHVKPSLELLRNAGVKIWMLTGDKVETARCVAISSKLVSRGQYIHMIVSLRRKEVALDALSILQSQPNACLLIDGQSLQLYLTYHRDAFISLAVVLPAVIACRCSPTQKADVARLIRAYTKKRVCCIGDGGNDVSMIQAADVGVGIVGKEGRQASLAADFSITQFAHLTKLLVWHGRNSYKRSAKLAQFVIHRGLIISVCQTVFSIASKFEPIALYRDWLLVGYATLYTMAPVFSLVLDRDVDEKLANLYPELYKELTSGRSLSYRTFFIWVGISIYQGLIIQGGSQLLVPSFSTDGGFSRMVAVSFTVLVLNELIMVAAEVTTWHWIMICSILGTAAVYFASLPFLGGYFDLHYLVTLGFWWRVAAISGASLVPVWAGKVIRRRVKPPNYRKVQGI
ncbi:putative aminophospholipid-translocase [Elasticomyces elasticus]|nr:putative aminophospholipid-translocase [Elasticomyces elasticus]